MPNDFVAYEDYPKPRYRIGDEVAVIAELRIGNPPPINKIDGLVLGKAGVSNPEFVWEYLVRGKPFTEKELINGESAEEINAFVERLKEGKR